MGGYGMRVSNRVSDRLIELVKKREGVREREGESLRESQTRQKRVSKAGRGSDVPCCLKGLKSRMNSCAHWPLRPLNNTV